MGARVRACLTWLQRHAAALGYLVLVVLFLIAAWRGTPGSSRKIDLEQKHQNILAQQLCDSLSASRVASNRGIRTPLRSVILTQADILEIASHSPANVGTARARLYRDASERLRRQASRVHLVGEYQCVFTEEEK